MGRSAKFIRTELALRDFALSFPETTEEFPWGHRTIKVRGKAFIFMGSHEDGLSFSVKLPSSAQGVLMLPFATPTGYGLGKSGWVTASFAAKDSVPVEWIESWIEESYAAVAPKRLLRDLETSRVPAAPPRPGKALKKKKSTRK